jgi:heme A synthase
MLGPRMIIAAALAGVAAIVSGAFITSQKVSLQPGQPEPSAGAHRVIAYLAILLICAACAATRSQTRRIVLGGALLCLIAAALTAWTPPLSPGAAVFHAALAHLFTASIAVALVMATPAWNQPVQPLPAGSFTALRPAAVTTPFAVFTQIVLGALYRHQLTGIMPHMLMAMVVALLTLVVSAVVLQNFSESAELKRAAALLLSAVLLQVCLGIAVFLLLLLNGSDTVAFLWLATAHVTTGTLVLATSILMAIEARRRLAPAESAP